MSDYHWRSVYASNIDLASSYMCLFLWNMYHFGHIRMQPHSIPFCFNETLISTEHIHCKCNIFAFVIQLTSHNNLWFHLNTETHVPATVCYTSKWASIFYYNLICRPEWLSEWLNLTAFLGTVGSEVHIVHISRVIIAYTHNLQATIYLRDGNSTSVYKHSKYLTSSLDWHRATDCNIKATRRD